MKKPEREEPKKVRQLSPMFIELVSRKYCELANLDPDSMVECEDEKGNVHKVVQWCLIATEAPTQIAWFSAIYAAKFEFEKLKQPSIITPDQISG